MKSRKKHIIISAANVLVITGGLVIFMAASFTACGKPKGDQGEIQMRKKFDSEVKRLTNIKAFSLADVKLEDEYFLDVTQKDVDFLNTFVVFQCIDLNLIVEVTDIADDGLVFHLKHVLEGDDVAVACACDEDVAFLNCLFHRGDFIAFHRSLQSADRVDFGDEHAGSVGTHRLCATFTNVAVA